MCYHILPFTCQTGLPKRAKSRLKPTQEFFFPCCSQEEQSLKECTLMHTHNHFCGEEERELLVNVSYSSAQKATTGTATSIFDKTSNVGLAALGKYGKTWVGELRHEYCPAALNRRLPILLIPRLQMGLYTYILRMCGCIQVHNQYQLP